MKLGPPERPRHCHGPLDFFIKLFLEDRSFSVPLQLRCVTGDNLGISTIHLPLATDYSTLISMEDCGSGHVSVISESGGSAASKEVGEEGRWSYPERVCVWPHVRWNWTAVTRAGTVLID